MRAVELELLHILLHTDGTAMSVFKREGMYQMRQRVPRRFRAIEPRGANQFSAHGVDPDGQDVRFWFQQKARVRFEFFARPGKG